MIFVGKLFGVSKDFETNKYLITFLMDEGNLSFLDEIKDKSLKITAVLFKSKRSKNANALLWECISKIAKAKRMDKWDVYLDILKHYGKYTYIVVRPNAVEGLKKIWREVEVIGDVDCNGQLGTQCLCFYGSSTYDVAEFNDLLQSVFAEMEGMGLESPTQEELKRSLDEWNQYCKKNENVSSAEGKESQIATIVVVAHLTERTLKKTD